MNKSEVSLLLKQLEVKPNKNLGQNFIIDKNVINKILFTSDLSKDDILLEIGPGLGALTVEFIDKVKKIYAIEIDFRLYSYLNNKFSIYDNIEIIHGDVLKVDLPPHNKFVSNIPYTITGPIIEKVFFRNLAPLGVLVIEKDIANRIFLSKNYKDISRITIGVNLFMNPVYKSNISNMSFYPNPKISLSLIKMIPKEKLHPFLLDKSSRKFFLKFIAGIMPYKNKNIANAIYHYFQTLDEINYSKQEIIEILSESGYVNNKLLSFSTKNFIKICKLFYF